MIVSYDLATRNLDKFKKFNFQAAIVDEAHFLKSMTVRFCVYNSQIDLRI